MGRLLRAPGQTPLLPLPLPLPLLSLPLLLLLAGGERAAAGARWAAPRQQRARRSRLAAGRGGRPRSGRCRRRGAGARGACPGDTVVTAAGGERGAGTCAEVTAGVKARGEGRGHGAACAGRVARGRVRAARRALRGGGSVGGGCARALRFLEVSRSRVPPWVLEPHKAF